MRSATISAVFSPEASPLKVSGALTEVKAVSVVPISVASDCAVLR
jgi:hypothetical protein